MYSCLGVTCHLQLWQNDRGLLRATVVIREYHHTVLVGRLMAEYHHTVLVGRLMAEYHHIVLVGRLMAEYHHIVLVGLSLRPKPQCQTIKLLTVTAQVSYS